MYVFIREMQLDNFLYVYIYVAMQIVWIYFLSEEHRHLHNT